MSRHRHQYDWDNPVFRLLRFQGCACLFKIVMRKSLDLKSRNILPADSCPEYRLHAPECRVNVTSQCPEQMLGAFPVRPSKDEYQQASQISRLERTEVT